MNSVKYHNISENEKNKNEETEFISTKNSEYEKINQNDYDVLYNDDLNNDIEMQSSYRDIIEVEIEEKQEYNDDEKLIPTSSNYDSENIDIKKINSTETSTISGSTFNFTNSIIGAGVIGMPLALKESGVVTGIILLFLLTWLVDWTVGILIKDSKLSGQKTYQGLMYFCFGNIGFIVISIFQFIFAFGGMCAYGIIVGDTISVVFSHILSPSSFLYPILTSRSFIICITTFFIILPLSLNKDISKLAKTSFLSLLGMMFITFSVIYEGLQISDDLKGDPSQQLTIINSDIFQCIGVISFAFVCHHNSLIILGSLKKPTMDRFSLVTHLSTGWSFIVSLFIGLGGYMIFTDKTKGNILNNFPEDLALINIARLFFAFNMFLTSPLECFVCRDVIINLLNPNSIRNNDNQDKNKEIIELPFNKLQHIIVTLCIILCSLFISLTISDLGFVLELTGGFSATMLAYILPTACYCKLTSESIFSKKKLAHLLCILFGLIVMISSTILSIYNYSNGKNA